MKNRRRIIFVRQGIQGLLPLLISTFLILISALLGFFIFRRCETVLKACLSFAHFRCDAPIELVKGEIKPYIVGGLGGVIVSLAAMYTLYINYLKKAFRRLNEAIKSASEGNLHIDDRVKLPYEIMLLREKLQNSMTRVGGIMEYAGSSAEEIMEMVNLLKEEENEDLRAQLIAKIEMSSLSFNEKFYSGKR